MSPIVSLREVHKTFGANPVLKGVSFEVNKGEMIAIIGASGSGKSTALRCMDRLETIDSGSITLGAMASERAMATRCCWPPDSCSG